MVFFTTSLKVKLEYKLNPIKEELENFFMLMCLDSEIKIIVKYGNMVAIDK
ncbi:MAG: hypothetical protein C5S40_05970 [ANME-2 cluster archaeon]|nr:hypothetical protein [ANME-2 cluster archaeon]